MRRVSFHVLCMGLWAVLLPPGMAQMEEMMATPPPAEQTAATASAEDLFNDGKIRLIIRTDDIGFCHAANAAFERIATEGCVTAASVIVNTPWLDEAVETLRAHPEISVGVHTCLNSEWWPYRWGPVLPYDEVPSLVDEWGHFFGTRALLRAHGVNLDEFEREIRAQIDLALRKGLNLSYIDHHMSAAVDTPEMRERFEQVAHDYGLAISRYFGERANPIIYSVLPEKKADAMIARLKEITEPGLYLMVIHPGLDVPEMASLHDLNETGLPEMSRYRQAETDALCDPRLRRLLEERGIELIGYDVLQRDFLDRMRRPEM
jgi:predicted glycoside hydrolase/deacetylase ChbG (UPF0249 family)